MNTTHESLHSFCVPCASNVRANSSCQSASAGSETGHGLFLPHQVSSCNHDTEYSVLNGSLGQ
jgi:hypothetical protein